MNKDVKHVAIAEIYRAVDKIRDFTNTLINATDEDKRSIMLLCEYIQSCDKILHDELYPECKENE